MVDPFAALSSFLPMFRGFKIFWPPGESAALFGTQIIDCALLSLQKDAVVIAGMFTKRNAIPNAVSIFADEFFFGNLEMIGQGFNFSS